jgi:hypothetical protein
MLKFLYKFDFTCFNLKPQKMLKPAMRAAGVLSLLVLAVFVFACDSSEAGPGVNPTQGKCFDNDHDGYKSGGNCEIEASEFDCNDGNPDVFPNQTEVCDNGLDDNCNGIIDKLDSQCFCKPDQDGDGYSATPESASQCPSEIDCNDFRDDVYPQNDEDCIDGRDNNCDGLIDAEDTTCQCLEFDEDGDGYPAFEVNDESCKQTADCNDDPTLAGVWVSPSAPEICNSIDDNCDGDTDECPELHSCEQDSGLCKKQLGAACTTVGECASGLACSALNGIQNCRGLSQSICETRSDCVSGDCEFDTTGACSGDECVKTCSASSCEDLNCSGDTPLCGLVEAESIDSTCVECLFDSDCNQTAGEQCLLGRACGSHSTLERSLSQQQLAVALLKRFSICWEATKMEIESNPGLKHHFCEAVSYTGDLGNQTVLNESDLLALRADRGGPGLASFSWDSSTQLDAANKIIEDGNLDHMRWFTQIDLSTHKKICIAWDSSWINEIRVYNCSAYPWFLQN